jgi:DNA-binding MarR family transcriptional regulator
MQIDPFKLPARISCVTLKILVALQVLDRPNNTKIAKVCQVTTSAITQGLAKLRHQGLVLEVPHPTNRQESQHLLTRKGRHLVASWQPDSARQSHHSPPAPTTA